MPGQRQRVIVDILFSFVGLLGYLPQNTAGDTAIQVGAIASSPISLKVRTAFGGPNRFGTYSYQFISQDRLKPSRTWGKKSQRMRVQTLTDQGFSLSKAQWQELPMR